jgi:hypothetical protein
VQTKLNMKKTKMDESNKGGMGQTRRQNEKTTEQQREEKKKKKGVPAFFRLDRNQGLIGWPDRQGIFRMEGRGRRGWVRFLSADNIREEVSPFSCTLGCIDSQFFNRKYLVIRDKNKTH